MGQLRLDVVYVLGPVYGLDDLLWRGIVWAARKPFVMQALPSFVTMRVDDVSNPFGPLNWVGIASDVGFKPWLGLFLNDIDSTEAAQLSGTVNTGHATAGAHAWSTDDFFYWDHYSGIPFSDATLAAYYANGTAWFQSRNIPISEVHGASLVQDWVERVPGIGKLGRSVPGDRARPWHGGWRRVDSEWSLPPVRVRVQHLAGSALLWRLRDGARPFRVQRTFLQLHDRGPRHRWRMVPLGRRSRIGYSGQPQLRRALDGLILPVLFTHENDLAGITSTNWRSIMQGVADSLASYQPVFVTMDYGCRYVRAMYTSNIDAGGTYNPGSQALLTSLSGQTGPTNEVLRVHERERSDHPDAG